EEFDPMAGGYPVPPLPGQKLPPVPRRPSRQDRDRDRALVGAGATGDGDTDGGAAAEKTDGKEADGV
ncbi:MAG: NADH-quinone oxidoreductase subunit NuoH, partial [Streptomyces sp.]